MGSKSSKSASSGNEHKTSNGTDQKHTPTQTSIYGWGRIKHPLKPGANNKTNESKSGKDKSKAKQNGFQVNEIRMPNTNGTPTSGTGTDGSTPVEKRKEHETPVNTPVSPATTNGAAPDKNEIKENGNHTGESVTDGGSGAVTPTPPPSSPSSGNTTPFRKQVLSNPSFYGHYRCPGCSKYWRSGHSKEGCAQNCAKCGTPTTPRR